MATATLITDKEIGAPWIKESGGIKTGQRKYFCDTTDEGEALAATNLPVGGEHWSESEPELKVWERATEYDSGPAGQFGRTIVTIDYSEADSTTVFPQAGVTHTVLSYADETLTQRYDERRRTQGGFATKIAGGDGCPRRAGLVRAEVHVFQETITQAAFVKMIRLARTKALNQSPLTLPAVLGSAFAPQLDFEEAQYEGFRVDRRGNVLEVVHELSLAPRTTVGTDPPQPCSAFDCQWHKENQDGQATGEPVVSQVYPRDDLGGLW